MPAPLVATAYFRRRCDVSGKNIVGTTTTFMFKRGLGWRAAVWHAYQPKHNASRCQ
jgi:hypothetical protein